MDLNNLSNNIKEDLIKQYQNIPKEIINEFIDLTFWGASWCIYGNNIDVYLLGIAEGKYDYYYVCCNEKYEIQLISCALEIKQNDNRKNDYITTINNNCELFSKESNNNWKIIRQNIKDYFEKNKQDKLLYFQDHILSEEHYINNEIVKLEDNE